MFKMFCIMNVTINPIWYNKPDRVTNQKGYKMKYDTKVIHSESKTAWNVVNTRVGGTYKLARVPYTICNTGSIDERERKRALNIARYISECLNNYKEESL